MTNYWIAAPILTIVVLYSIEMLVFKKEDGRWPLFWGFLVAFFIFAPIISLVILAAYCVEKGRKGEKKKAAWSAAAGLLIFGLVMGLKFYHGNHL